MARRKNIQLLALILALGVFSFFSIQFGWQQLDPLNSPVPLASPIFILGEQNTATDSARLASSSAEIAQVKRVIDGDTIELMDGRKVRYIGVDTPETKAPNTPVECFGVQASEFNRQLVEGQSVRLEKDVSETDRYGRLLRYVYRGEELINLTLVQEGYAFASSYPPDIAKQDILTAAEATARLANRGLWASCPLP